MHLYRLPVRQSPSTSLTSSWPIHMIHASRTFKHVWFARRTQIPSQREYHSPLLTFSCSLADLFTVVRGPEE
jgi:hypothetical protein